jgi:amino-acid N-acetyltransferase
MTTTARAAGIVRKAVLKDAPGISALIEPFARKGMMLSRPLAEICASLRDFFVYEEAGGVAGASALHICSDEMGEIRSLAVKDGFTGRGIGSRLVAACLDEARSLGMKKVFALTYQEGFFRRLGFKAIKKEGLPHKIWGDCLMCVKFPLCDEVAVIIDISASGGAHG